MVGYLQYGGRYQCIGSLDAAFSQNSSSALQTPMTLLVAIQKDEDTIFVGADGKSISKDVHSYAAAPETADKIDRIPGRNLVWGYRGIDLVGEPFRDYIIDHCPLSWDEMKEVVGPMVRSLNKAHSEQGSETSILVAGFLGGTAGIREIDHWGNIVCEKNECFSGFGRVATKVAWGTINRYASESDFEERFLSLMEIAIGGIEGLGPPVSVWKVTSSDCARVR
jgi:hypothetical protein